MQLPKMNRIRTTNPIADILQRGLALDADFERIDAISRIRASDSESYEEKEKEIPELILEVLRKRAMPSTKLVGRGYMEQDSWLVRIECSEGEQLSDHGHEVLSGDGKCMVPALIEDETVSMHFVRIRVPRIFVRTVSLPMIMGEH